MGSYYTHSYYTEYAFFLTVAKQAFIQEYLIRENAISDAATLCPTGLHLQRVAQYSGSHSCVAYVSNLC